jgi:pimeloyl-ACP methyl ester carboxylesterase
MDEFLRAILPISARREGILFDLTRLITAPPYPLERIHTPTLVVHARDDSLVSFAHAEHAAGRIPDARLVAIEEGGHMAYTMRSDAVPQVRAFLSRQTSSGAGSAPMAAAPR